MLLFCDSFDHYATGDLTEKYASVLAVPTIGAYGRRSSNGLRASGAPPCAVFAALGAAPATVVVGVAVKIASLSATPGGFLALFDGPGGQAQLVLSFNVDGSLTLTRAYGYGQNTATSPLSLSSGTVLASSASGVVAAGAWAFVEIKATIHGSAGSAEVRVNGAAVISVSGANTQGSGSAQITSVVLGMNAWNADPSFDDFYACDTSGSVNDDFLGDVRVDAHYPTGAGATAGWSASAGSNYACVDENPANDDTDYVSTSTLNAIDTYAFEDLKNAGGTIRAVQVVASCRKSDAGACSVAPVVRRGGTDYIGTAGNPDQGYAYIRRPYDVDPSTSAAWTETDFNGAEFGVKKTA